MRIKRAFVFWILASCISMSGVSIAEAGSSFFYKELNAIAGYSTRDDFADKASTLMNSVGFEDYRKFSSEYGDYLTTDVQVRFAYDTKDALHDAWGFQIHNAWLRYKTGYGIYIKAGRFDPYFGLEPVIDTHGTILQTLLIRNIGFKKDWGIGVEGSFPKFDYKAGFQIGSGMSIRRKDDSFLTSARVNSLNLNGFQYGTSFLCGNILQSTGMSTLPRNHLLSEEAPWKIRGGLDLQYLWNAWLLKTEFAYGADGKKDVLGYMTELNYTPPKYQNWQAKVQFQSWINDLGKRKSDDSTLGAVLSYSPTQKITLRAAYQHDVNLKGKKEDNRFLLQFYYYGT